MKGEAFRMIMAGLHEALDHIRGHDTNELVSRWAGSRTWIGRESNHADFKRFIESLWEKGELPRPQGKGWIVGYRVWLSYGSSSATPITVGPGRPSKYHSHYAVCITAKRAF